MKKIFYGKSDFAYIREQNGYYIDKTSFIEILENFGSEYLFFFRPRRFGKTLFLSTLEHYYDINRKDDFEKLFGDLYIGKNPTPLRNSFPILRLNFSKVTADSDLKNIEEEFDLNILLALETFYVFYPEQTGGIEAFERDIKSLQKAKLMLNRFLTTMAQIKFNFYLLIDEYDNFANNLLAQHGKDKYYEITHGTGFLRGFFNVIKAGTDSNTIARIFATGVTPLLLSDVTSGFNIGRNISLRKNFNEMLGFTQDEVMQMLDYYISQGAIKDEDRAKCISIMKKVYDGYIFSSKGKQTLHNSTSVLHFIDLYLADGELPQNYIDSNLKTDYQKLEYLVIEDKKLNGNFSILTDLLTSGQYKGELIDTFAVNELIDTNKFISFLYYLGLLTMKVDENNNYVFLVPNETCSEILWGYVKRAIDRVFAIDTRELTKKFSDMKGKGEWRSFFEYLLGQLYENTSLRDFIQKEATLKGFLLPFLILLRDIHIYSEYELNKGFADFYIVPDLLRAPNMCPNHYLIELKYIKKSDLTEANQEQLVETVKTQAIKQLNQYAQDPRLANVPLVKLVMIVSNTGLLLLEQIS